MFIPFAENAVNFICSCFTLVERNCTTDNGVTYNTFFAGKDLWYAFLTVYSDSFAYNKVEFRKWQASTAKTYEATPAIPVNFVNEAIVGTSGNPVIFDGSELVFQDITLKQD